MLYSIVWEEIEIAKNLRKNVLPVVRYFLLLNALLEEDKKIVLKSVQELVEEKNIPL